MKNMKLCQLMCVKHLSLITKSSRNVKYLLNILKHLVWIIHYEKCVTFHNIFIELNFNLVFLSEICNMGGFVLVLLCFWGEELLLKCFLCD